MYKIYLFAFFTLLKKEIRRFLRIWQQTLFPPLITLSLYFLIFGNLIGARIGSMQGISYIEFIVPGLVMMTIINSSFANVVSSFFSVRFHGAIDEMLVAPIPNWIILLGFISGGIVRGLLAGTLAIIISLFFVDLSLNSIFLTFLVALLAATLFSLAGFINGLFANSFDDISVFPTFILTPLIYLGGVFYSVDILPDFWQKISYFNPIFYIIDAFRQAILDKGSTHFFLSLLSIGAFIVLLFALALYLMRLPGKLRK